MDRKKISSSSIRSIGFDERSRVLEVEFNDGRVMQYSGVSAEVHRRAGKRAIARELLSRQHRRIVQCKAGEGVVVSGCQIPKSTGMP